MARKPCPTRITRLIEETSEAGAVPDLEMTQDMFIDFCILSGCDYTDTISQIGPVTAFNLIKEHKNIDTILEVTLRQDIDGALEGGDGLVHLVLGRDEVLVLLLAHRRLLLDGFLEALNLRLKVRPLLPPPRRSRSQNFWDSLLTYRRLDSSLFAPRRDVATNVNRFSFLSLFFSRAT